MLKPSPGFGDTDWTKRLGGLAGIRGSNLVDFQVDRALKGSLQWQRVPALLPEPYSRR